MLIGKVTQLVTNNRLLQRIGERETNVKIDGQRISEY